jgi:predicted aldo/keto reductase-like oxidoreductase
MIYKAFQGEHLSALGLGAMRLPTAADGSIDKTATAEMVAYAMQNGVNYYDTAWGYHNGQSEPVMGEILSAYPRDSFKLASKFPGYDLSNMGKVKEIFEKQLERCRVDYFDFYMFHNVCEMNLDGYLDPANGIYDYLIQQKANGRIRHLGFSTHAALPGMRRFLEAYGKDMEFC